MEMMCFGWKMVGNVMKAHIYAKSRRLCARVYGDIAHKGGFLS